MKQPIAKQVIDRVTHNLRKWQERLDHATNRKDIREALRMLTFYEGMMYELEEA